MSTWLNFHPTPTWTGYGACTPKRERGAALDTVPTHTRGSLKQMQEGAHHLEEGGRRVIVVGLLVPQHQIVSSVNDDLL